MNSSFQNQLIKMCEEDSIPPVKSMNLLYDQYHRDPSFSTYIIQSINDKHTQIAGTWLLKKYIENDNDLSIEEVNTVLNGFVTMDHWQSKLHILQIIPFLKIPIEVTHSIEPSIYEELTNKRPFIRAAAINAYLKLTQYEPLLLNEFKEFCELRYNNEKASVRVSMRKVFNTGQP